MANHLVCHFSYCWTSNWYVRMKYEFVKCLEPRHITNIYTGKEILIECGKCEVCQMKKNIARTTRCKLETAVNKYTYFVTLTYDNKRLPLARLINVDPDTEIYELVDMETGEVYGSHEFKKNLDKQILFKKCGTGFGVIPILRYRDVQLFIKRLRKRLRNEKIRVFVCGEYGPVHFRPHYHLMLWFNQEKTYENIQQAISESWTFGRIDAQLTHGKSSSYVAGYLNGSANLPPLFKFRRTSPFSRHSFYLGESVFQDAAKEIQEHEFERVANKRFFGNGINTDCVLWRSLKTRILPRCKGYSEKSEQQRVFSYLLNAKIRSWTQEDNPAYQARFIADYVRYFDFYHEIPECNEILQYFRKGMNYYQCDEHGVYRYIQPALVDYDKFERSVYMELLTSRRFIRDVCHGNINIVTKQVRLMDDFYKYLDYENLKNQLKLEQQLTKTSDKYLIKYFFHNKFVVKDLQNENIFKRFKSSKLSMYKDMAKHKELNDKNLIFNYI